MRIKVPITRVVGHIRSECFQDYTVVAFNLFVAFFVLCRFKSVLDGQYTAYVQEELGCEATTVICNGFRRSAVLKHSLVTEVFRYFGCRDYHHGYRLRYLGEPVRKYKKVFGSPSRAGEWPEDMNIHLLQWFLACETL